MSDDKKLVRRVARSGYYSPEEDVGGWMIFCPACQCGHLFDDKRWTFNGNEESPTFAPSMKVSHTRGEPPVTPENLEEYRRAPWPQTDVVEICHSVVTDGIIHFQNDCTHALKGQAVPMERF